MAVTTQQYDSAVAASVYKPFSLVSFPSNGTYSKTLNNLWPVCWIVLFRCLTLHRGEVAENLMSINEGIEVTVWQGGRERLVAVAIRRRIA